MTEPRRHPPRWLFAATFAVLLAGFLAAVFGFSAQAAYDPGAEIVSIDNATDEQADDAVTQAVMTPDGRYVVFQTRAENFFGDNDPDPAGAHRVGGIFRYDRVTGDLRLVADGDLVKDSDASLLVKGASNPSVSDDGRFVAFTTGQRLVSADANNNLDVYVRDMSVPLKTDRIASGAFTLVSAKDGGDTPASYSQAPGSPPPDTGQHDPGAQVSPGTAISANGRYVAFSSGAWNSDLPDHATTDTPPDEVFVRDLAAKRTALLTVMSFTQGGGTLGSPAGGLTGNVVISADGSTVAWLGANATAQTQFVKGENPDATEHYYLLRRWQDPNPVTIRFTGLADPTNPLCDPNTGPIATDFNTRRPCDGPLTGREASDLDFQLPAPALSADGKRIAYVAVGELRPALSSIPNQGFDAFYVNLGSSAYRTGGLKASTSELTRQGFNNSDPRANGSIDTVSISRDGRYVGLTSFRDVFNFPALSPIGTFRAAQEAREGYVVDTVNRTIERAITNNGGGDSNGSVLGPLSLSSDAGVIAFVSTADNLIFGDANGVSDTFVVHRTPQIGRPPTTTETQTGPQTLTNNGGGGPKPLLRVSATRKSDGSIQLTLHVPGSGQLFALAKHGRTVVARATGNAGKAGTYYLHLVLLSRYAGPLRRGKGVTARVTVIWSPKAPKIPKKTYVNVTFKRSRVAGPRKRH